MISNISRKRQRGFTLIEVLVALAIFGVIAISVFATMQNSVRQQAIMEQRLAANLVAQQVLAEIRLRSPWPPIGEKTERVPQGQQEWQVTARVEDTSEERMRHITVEVGYADAPHPTLTLDAWAAREDARGEGGEEQR
ncbi:type II secretion system minor pseudopilin GspI [Microbulbifer hainanensis]|uniref:type II secretion system minor pseudopilin GspI n=1 Tax=Microbulbifer hainanensis TaxID=2735675 RepID=UPI001865C44C|nr:type II secretion system minor pseudopilin GspI [Microbulbifer hainanensis]